MRFARFSGMPRWTVGGHALGRGWPRLRGIPVTLLAIVVFAGLAWLAARLDPLPPRFTGTAQAADGDSLRVQGDRVRLIGIDAPELDQTCWREDGSAWACGRDARAELARLVAAGPVTCQPEGTDKFGRTLAVCTVADRDVGAGVVEAGLALARQSYGGEESAAKRAKRGLWAGRFVDPRTWRDQGPSGDLDQSCGRGSGPGSGS